MTAARNVKKNKIKLKHNYMKLHNQRTAILIDVQRISRTELGEDTIKYDTAYAATRETNAGQLHGFEYYTLPNGLLLQLTFRGDKNIPFTTYRKYRDKSWSDYCGKISQEFEVVVSES